MSTAILAIDVGTTSAKASVVVDGHVGVVCESPIAMSHPQPGWVEQDAEAWWLAAADAAVRALDAADDAVPATRSAVAAIAVTGQMQDLLCIGNDGPLRPVILYADGRAAVQHEELLGHLGPAWSVAVGAEPDATNVGAKWAWLQANEPEIVQRTTAVLLGAAGYVVWRLGGAATSDPTTAATTGLYDLHRGAWWAPVVEHLSIPVPALCSPTGAAATLGASVWGLRPGLPVIHGCGDAVSTTIGIVGDAPGRPYAYIGTSGWVATVVGDCAPREGVILLPALGPESFVAIAPILTAGAAVDWMRAVLFDVAGTGMSGAVDADPALDAGDAFDAFGAFGAFDALAAEVCAAAEQVLFLPHLDGSRSPHPNPNATGVLIGVRRSTSRSVLAAAAYEGVAHALRAIAVSVAPDATELLLCGGASRSAVLAQVVADVFDRPVVVADEAHASLRGVASMARVALGEAAFVPTAAGRRYVPRPSFSAAHRQIAPIVDSLNQGLTPTLFALAGLRQTSVR